jgi:hypothetical protein
VTTAGDQRHETHATGSGSAGPTRPTWLPTSSSGAQSAATTQCSSHSGYRTYLGVEDFWELVSSCVRTGGRVFLIDNRRDLTRTTQDPYAIDEADDVQRRRLGDGSEHRVVKVLYELDEPAEQLIYGSATPGPAAGTAKTFEPQE